MRPVLQSDLDLSALAILSVPSEDRFRMVCCLLETADIADRYRKRIGRIHPEFGDGSLGSVARKLSLDARGRHCMSSYLAALAVVVDAVLTRRHIYKRRP